MRFIGRSLVGLFLLCLTFGLLAMAGGTVYRAVSERLAEEPFQRPQRERVFAVNTVTVTPEEIAPEIQTFGEIRASRSLLLRASEGGVVVETSENLVEGGRVSAGEVLIRLDPADAEARLARAETGLREAQDTLREAERGLVLARDELTAGEEQLRLRRQALARQQDLLNRGVGTAAALEAAELAVSSAEQAVVSRRQAVAGAEARLDQARTGLLRAEIDVSDGERALADTLVIAPFDGVLSGVEVVPGGRLSAQAELGRLIDASALEVVFRVSTAQYLQLVDDTGLRDAEVSVRLDVGGVDLVSGGMLTRESAAVSAGETGRRLFAKLDEATGFRPGDFVTVAVAEEPMGGLARLPATAVGALGDLLVLGAEGRLEAVPVDILRRQGDDVLIRARDLAGRQVVAERTPLLGAGIRVRPLDPEAAPAEPEMLALTAERRERLLAFVRANQRMPAEVKERMLATLEQDQVPAQMVQRLESRMGG